jgi:hypothetical protein
MNYVTLSDQKVPIVSDVDVFVAGGGCAGIGAGIAAARKGAKTLIAERMFCLGGMMTSGLMSKLAIAPRNHGLGQELIERLDLYQGTNFLASRPEVPIDPELAKHMLDKMVIEEAGAEVLFGTTITGVISENRIINTVIIDSVNGLEAVRAKYFIDCTGDGQLGFKAGASYVVGDDEGYSSSPTLMFRIANVNIEKLISEMDAHPDIYQASAHDRYTLHQLSPKQNRENIMQNKYAHFADFIPYIRQKAQENPGMFTEWELEMMLQRGIIFMNQPQGTHVLVNSTRIPFFKGNDNRELTNAVVSGRKQVEATFRFMKAFVPGFEASFIMDTADLLGIRESRRITGDYVFTEKDVESLRKFDDAVVSNHGGIEIHSPHGEGTKIRELQTDDYYHVPYRSIIAKDFDNLFIAGRCFSANHPALSAARNITYCIALGQAAGTAAVQLVHSGKINVREINIKALQDQLVSLI